MLLEVAKPTLNTHIDSQTIINNWPNKNLPSRKKNFQSKWSQRVQHHTTVATTIAKILQGGLLWHKIDYPCKWTSLFFTPFYNLVSFYFYIDQFSAKKITKKSDLAAHEIKIFSVIPNEYLWTIIEEEGKEFYCTKIMIFIHSFCVFLGCSYYALDFTLFFCWLWMCVVGWDGKKIVYFGWTLMNYFFYQGGGEGVFLN